MSHIPGGHEPTAEFRSLLESRVIDELRGSAPVTASSRTARWQRFRTAALILLSLAAGAAGGVGSAQVQDGRERERLLAAERAELEVATMRVELARERAEAVRRAVAVGATDRQAMAAAQAELAAMEANLARLRLNMEEIQASAKPARDDLTAPRVRQRDYVAERLRLELATAQSRLVEAEALAADARRRRDAGIMERLAQVEVEAGLAEARSEMERLVRRAELREEVLRRNLAPAEVARREQRLELEQELKRAEALRALSQERLNGLRQRQAAGMVERLDVLGAEVEVLRREREIEAMRQLLARERE
jgi:hypothetical protein